MMSKTGVIGYLGSFKIPEVVMGVNSFALSAQAVNPKIKVKLVMIDSWFDPAKEAAAAETLANLGCDFVATHTDSPAALQVLEKRKLYGFGQGADMSRFAPHAQLTSILDIWGPYCISRAKAVHRRDLEVGRQLVGRQGRPGAARPVQQGRCPPT